MRFTSLFLLAALPLAAQSPIESTFAGGTGVFSITGPATSLFDIAVTDPAGITIHRFEVGQNPLASIVGTLSVYVTAVGGTANGNHLNAAAWTLVGTSTVTHTGGRTTFTLATPFHLPPGAYGMALHQVGMTPLYCSPVSFPNPPGLPQTYTRNEITLDMSAARIRASLATNPFGGTAAGFTPRNPQVAIHYVSGPVLVDWTATPTTGVSPLNVQFTSRVFSANPGGILALSWDFESDGIPDSGLADPSFTFGCGDWNVSLTVVDSVGPTTVTKNNFVRTDLITPSFTNQLVGPNALLFVDTTTPPAQTWDWDLDGDGISDSALSNPVFIYPSGCDEVTVTLTVSRACQPPVTLQKRIAIATTFETVFTGNTITTTTAPGSTNFFDVDVANPLGVTVCSMHVHSAVPANSPLGVRVWQKTGTHVGFVTDPTPWRLVADLSVVSRGGGDRTFVAFDPPLHFAFGLNGLAIEQIGTPGARYSNFGAPTTFTGTDFTLTTGLVQESPIFGQPPPNGTSAQFTPRVWNGALHFGTTQTDGAAGYGYIGAGCPGALGVPGNRSAAPPSIGSTFTATVDRLPFDIALFMVGNFRIVPAVDLAIIGFPGCPLHVTPDILEIIAGAPGSTTASISFAVPASVTLVGHNQFTQALAFDITLPGQFGSSDAASAVVGF